MIMGMLHISITFYAFTFQQVLHKKYFVYIFTDVE